MGEICNMEENREPNNWESVFGGPAWEFDAGTGMYYLHLFSRKQPDLNWENARVRREVYDMMDWWCQKGIDGFRMDVISMISKDQAFPDGAVKENGYGDFSPFVRNGPRVHEFLREMNREVLAKYDLLTVGECSGVTVEEAKKYANEEGTELDMVFQFEHMDLDGGETFKWNDRKIDLVELKEVLSRWQRELDGKAWNSLYWCNHDQPRILPRLGSLDPAYREISAKMLATCLHMMQGTPYIYQGEEIGMTNAPFASIEDFRDVETRNCWQERVVKGGEDPEKLLEGIRHRARDNARTPMQWDDTENAGFTSGTPWIMVNPNYKEINVKESLEDPDSIFHYMQQLIRMRKSHAAAVYGDFREYQPEHEKLYIYERNYEGQKLYVVLNFSDTDTEFVLPEAWKGEEAEPLLGNYPQEPLKNRRMRPYEAAVYIQKEK